MENVMKKLSMETLINALWILAKNIQSDDGVANAAIAESATRLEELKKYQEFYDKIGFLICGGEIFLEQESFKESTKKLWVECQFD